MIDRELALIEALRRYGQHRPSCNAARALPFEKRRGEVKCTCGFDAALSPPAIPEAEQCPSHPGHRCQVDTSMESGPSNCFHCERPMP
jgi:hypothetical protein